MRGDDFISFVGKKKRVFVTVVFLVFSAVCFVVGFWRGRMEFFGLPDVGIGMDGLFILAALCIRVSLSDSSCLFLFVCFLCSGRAISSG